MEETLVCFLGVFSLFSLHDVGDCRATTRPVFLL